MSKKLVWSRKEGKFLAIELEGENTNFDLRSDQIGNLSGYEKNTDDNINDDLNDLIDNLRAKEKEDSDRLHDTEQREEDKNEDKDKDKDKDRDIDRGFKEDADLSVNDLIDSLRTKELSHVLNEQNTSDDFWDIINSNTNQNQNQSQSQNQSHTPKSIPKPKINVPVFPIKTNRIDSRTETQFIKRSYHDQYLLERAWYLLGHKVLTEEISINTDLLENPNIIVPTKQISNPSSINVKERIDIDGVPCKESVGSA
ncbi:MAG: hypothetical protein WD512_20335, partial [Candidatus Paceibacterota bacterium]